MAITVTAPDVRPNLGDGTFSGLAGGSSGGPGTIEGYRRDSKFYNVPSVTAANTGVNAERPVEKLLLYINGIGTPRATHAYTVKLLSVVTSARVIGIYNQSGDGESPNAVADLLQCLGDKTGWGNNPATNTLANTAAVACIEGKFLNIVAHSQGAIITSRGMRQAIGMLLDYFGRQDPVVRPLLEEVDRINSRTLWQQLTASRSSELRNTTTIITLERELRERVKPYIENLLDRYISAQTFGGAARFYPNGPRYRHVYNRWDPVPNLVGQGDIMTGPGRGATVLQLDRNAGGWGPDFVEDHSITDVYLQPSNEFVDRQGRRVDSAYIPVDMGMVR